MDTINCNLSNDVIDDTEWSRIERQCKNQHHIDPSCDLKLLIANDEATVVRHGITFDQLDKFFNKIRKHFDKKINDHLQQFGYDGIYDITPTIFGSIIVRQETWRGAEQCPFQSPLDERYHGYEYGSHDWYFTNTKTGEELHIGDLLFHQISAHHFFQSPSSEYRVDPEKLITFFGLKRGVDYSTELNTTAQWVSGNGSMIGTRFTIKDWFWRDGDSPSHYTATTIGGNTFYLKGDDTLIVEVKDPSTLPTEFAGHPGNFALDCCPTGVYGMRKIDISEITVDEEAKDWTDM